VNWPEKLEPVPGLKPIWKLAAEPPLMVAGRLPWLLRKKFSPETFTCEIATGAEVTFRRRTFVVAVCPIGTLPKLMEPGEMLSGAASEEFGENPQPASEMTRQHATVTTSFKYQPWNVRIVPRPPTP
jgi:hypothetical protein